MKTKIFDAIARKVSASCGVLRTTRTEETILSIIGQTATEGVEGGFDTAEVALYPDDASSSTETTVTTVTARRKAWYWYIR